MTEQAKVTIRPNTGEYAKGRAASGAITLNNGDMVAQGLNGASLEQVYQLAADVMDVPQGELEDKYGHLNDGMQRMALGNRIRGWIKKADKQEDGAGTAAFEGEARALQAAIANETEAA